MQIFHSMPTISRHALLISTAVLLCLILVLSAAGCGASADRPLSIKMHNPKTNVTLDCAARDTRNQNKDLLADVVETCARQLESRGFIRAGSAD
jgi:predicted component of type VI protein secretion system